MKTQQLPDDVKVIMSRVAKFQYNELRAAGWCVSCYRKKAMPLSCRCQKCNRTHAEKQREKTGGGIWREGGRGRPPKRTGDEEQ
jgi:hypothetical protein